MTRRFIISTLTAFYMIAPSLSLANDGDEAKPKVIYKERTEIDFEGVEISGELVRPQGQLVMERHSAQFNPLIKLRKDFDKEIDMSIDEVK